MNRTTIKDGQISQLILASSSPRRKELVESLGLSLPVYILPTDADESVGAEWTPQEIVEQLSLRKANTAVRMVQKQERHIPPSLIVGSDTIVVLDGDVLGKPNDAEEAKHMLQRLQGRTHKVYTGVACLYMPSEMELPEAASLAIYNQMEATKGQHDDPIYLGETGQYRMLEELYGYEQPAAVGYTASKVTFKPLSDEEINAYVRTGEPLDKAGSYGVQGLGSVFIERIEGDFYSIMGLPLNILYQMLLKFGVSPFQQ